MKLDNGMSNHVSTSVIESNFVRLSQNSLSVSLLVKPSALNDLNFKKHCVVMI